jgi:small conductance mechanosensitive channel
MPAGALAAQWQGVLQNALAQALRKRQPAAERRNADIVLRVAVALAVASLLASALVATLRRRIGRLEEEAATHVHALQDEQSRPAPDRADAHRRRRRFLTLALRAADPIERLAFYRALAAALLWSLLLAWLGAVMWALFLFPKTTPLAHSLLRGIAGVAAIWIVTGLLNRLLDVAIARGAKVWHASQAATADDRTRQILRIPTIVHALAGFKTFVLVFMAALATLSQVGFPISSVVTIGGVAALAISFAAQNFIRDFVGGFLVLFEDHYVVGDFITVNAYSGLVENLNLRMVQIRNGAGDLITIPHSAVTNVVNQSRNWSRVDYRVPVDPSADVPKAIALVRVAFEELAKDEAWREAVLDPLEWIGVDALSRDWVVIRASMKTAPLRQFELRRQLNARVRSAFAAAGIGFGAPIPENA